MMKNNCAKIHTFANSLKMHEFPFDDTEIPLNGLYILFEKGEGAHGAKRIVRVGTHRGNNQLRSRLKEHFLKENKDRSIFRKNIGRAILYKDNDSFIEKWEWDLTSRASKEKYSPKLDLEKQQKVERRVSKCIRDTFSFVVIPANKKEERLDLESKIISTVSLCEICRPSHNWLGLHSPKKKIRESGLWLEQGLYKTPLSDDDIVNLKKYLD